MKRWPLAWLLVVPIVGGCMSVAQLSQSPAVRVGTLDGRYLGLATCVLSEVQANQENGVTYRFWNLAEGRTAVVLGMLRVPAGLFYTVPAPVVELRFKQADETRVTIETRTRFPGGSMEPETWTSVERCAGGAPLTVEPPYR